MAASFARYRYRPLFVLVMALLCTPAIAETSRLQGNKPFLASSINNSHPFTGQEILLTYTLYFRDIAPKISREVPPSFQGFWARESGSERFIKSLPATVQGEHFRSAVVKQFKLVPIQSGKITVSGYSMLCTLPQKDVGIEGKELPDSSVTITAPAMTISARALPQPVPKKHSGAVGIFELSLSSDKEKLNIGEPLSVKLTLTGTGSLLTLELPDVQLPENFRQNPPERAINLVKSSGTTSSGTITSTTLAWAQSEGNFQIPAVTLIVFNPDTQQFSTLHSKSVTVQVKTATQKATRAEEKPLDDTPSEKKGSENILFSTVTVALLLLVSGALIVLIKKKQLTKTKKIVGEGAANPSSETGISAKTMKQQLLALLADAGIKSPGGMTRMELQDALQEINLPNETRSELPEVLDSLDKILYSHSEAKESRIPDRIKAKVSALLHALKKVG